MEQTEKPLLTQGGRKRPRSDEQRAKERTWYAARQADPSRKRKYTPHRKKYERDRYRERAADPEWRAARSRAQVAYDRARRAADPAHRQKHTEKVNAYRYGFPGRAAYLEYCAARPACEICGSTHLLSIDHVHGHCEGTRGCMECVRGRLCRACNTGIGMFKDSEATLEKAVAYLRRTRTARG